MVIIMKYKCTRDSSTQVTGSTAIVNGLSNSGGLYVPEYFPSLSLDKIEEISKESYSRRASYIMSLFLTDFSLNELTDYTGAAYNTERENGFRNDKIAPLYKMDDSTYFLELWHGPTCAFKDMALQIMPRLLTASIKKTEEKRKVCILVATSGDTGKAALDGFCDIKNTKIMVFYPQNGVSQIQKLQMTSQKGNNVNVTAVEGNFDDAQAGVKVIFSDKALTGELDKKGFFLSSANSINWGRLVPQIVYYVSAYCDLLSGGMIKSGEKVNFCVPTGNFGNILAGYYAERMGLPVNKLICASNRNDVLTQFINTGVYDKNRPFYTTVSPSMDILVSSNLERLLYELSDKDGSAVSAYMKSLSEKGFYKITDTVSRELKRIFSSGYCSEEDTMKTIKNTFEKDGYLIDTHTAVAYKVLNDYRKASNDGTVSVVISTASPFKFCGAVLEALGQSTKSDKTVYGCDILKDETDLTERLSRATGCDIPAPLAALKNEVPRFSEVVRPDNMKESVLRFLREG